jgi:ribonuclease HI
VEVMAIILTLKEIKQRQDKHSSIFSESKSVLETLCSICPFEQRNPVILTIREEPLLLEEAGKTVHFYWIPAQIQITQ